MGHIFQRLNSLICCITSTMKPKSRLHYIVYKIHTHILSAIILFHFLIESFAFNYHIILLNIHTFFASIYFYCFALNFIRFNFYVSFSSTQARLRVLNEPEVLLICTHILCQKLIDIITYRSDAFFFQLL